MGLVYRAHDPSLEREVAIKVLRRVNDEVAASMREEARTLADLDHPNIVRVFDVGTSEGRTFVVMPLVVGETLARWARTARSEQARVNVLLQVAAGLEAAHRAGVLHRDVKPGNIMVDREDRALVVDFGLSRGRGPSTSTDEIVAQTSRAAGGTAGYVAPEQARGDPLDERADVYAFCMTAIECLTQRAPVPRHGPVCTQDELDALLALVPRRFREVLRRGTRHDPRARLPSIATVAQKLRTDSPGRRGWLAAAVVGAGLAVFALAQSPRPPPRVAMRATPQSDSRAAALLDRGRDDAARDAFAAAEANLQQAFEQAIAERDARIELEAAVAMADLLARQSRPARAGRWLKHARATLSRTDDAAASARVALAGSRVARARGDLEEARSLAVEALDRAPASSPRFLRLEALTNLGRIQFVQGQSRGAVQTLTEAVVLGRESNAPASLLGAALADLGACHLRHADTEAASAALDEGLALLRSSEHPANARVAMAAENLAIVRWRGGDLEGAMASFAAGTESMERAFGPGHPRVAHSLENLGAAQISAHDLDAALRSLNRALVIREQTSGSEHPDVARTLNYIAQAHEGAGNLKDAQTHAARAYEIAVATLGRDHSTTAESLAARSRIDAQLGELDRSASFAQQSLAIYETIGAGALELGASEASLAYALCGAPSSACRPGSERRKRARIAAIAARDHFIEAGTLADDQLAALLVWSEPLLD